ncbi:MAG TPA: hypothetical protein VLA93_21740, partial [Pyrinomonadaceae bacterium]|nr:hypothetical protein [Pyrinomonadaceae bacterium]
NPGAAAPVPSDSGLIPEAQPAPPPARKEATSQATPSADRAASTSAGNKAPEESKEGEVAAKRDETPPAAPVTVVAPAPSTGATITQPKTVSQADRNEPAAKKQAEVVIANVQNQNQNQIQNQQERRIYDQRSGPSEPKAVQRGQKSNEAVGGVSRQRAKIAEEQEKDAARDDRAETRTVGGHRFTKRGSVWVDALYESNSATTNVSRGSEQYRSLMGDEPGLRAIVDQLSGEIVVVWKGRPYRIK